MANRFGVEIEVNGFYSNQATAALNGLSDGCGGQFLVIDEEHNSYVAREYWKAVIEYSLSHGCEVISPPLPMNETSFTKVKTMLSHMRANEASMNSRCGAHIHLDATELDHWHITHVEGFFETLIKEYANNEERFDSFVNNTRRSGNNHYCKTMKYANLQNVYYDREHKLSPVSYFKHGTVEFRHYHGTLNGDALVAWIKVINTFFDNVLRKYKSENQNLHYPKSDAPYYEYRPRFNMARQTARGAALENFLRACEAA